MERQPATPFRLKIWFLAVTLTCLGGGEMRGADAASPGGKTRTYFIAADEVAWNYAPGGDVIARDAMDKVDSDVWLKRGLNGDPPIFRKAIFREYTDASFKQTKPRDAGAEYLGLLGPVIRAEV